MPEKFFNFSIEPGKAFSSLDDNSTEKLGPCLVSPRGLILKGAYLSGVLSTRFYSAVVKSVYTLWGTHFTRVGTSPVVYLTGVHHFRGVYTKPVLVFSSLSTYT